MNKEIRVSVALATYNGEKYIKEQMDSILLNLGDNDEIIVSDDGSTDETINIIRQYNDNRIKILDGPGKGVKKNFENAIINTKGKYIFLADQDDIWEEQKVNIVLNNFEDENISLVIHDAKVFDNDSNEIIYDSFFKHRKSGFGVLKNIYKNTYIGCCMAFRKELKKMIIPIPNEIEMHDQWIGIINEISLGKSLFIKDKLLKYRRHKDNVSKLRHYPLKKMIYNRLILIKKIIRWRENEKNI